MFAAKAGRCSGGGLPGNFLVIHPVKKMHRCGNLQRAAKPQIVPTVGDQVPGVADRLIGIGIRKGDDALGLDLAPLVGVELGPEQILGEIGCGGDADQASVIRASIASRARLRSASWSGSENLCPAAFTIDSSTCSPLRQAAVRVAVCQGTSSSFIP